MSSKYSDDEFEAGVEDTSPRNKGTESSYSEKASQGKTLARTKNSPYGHEFKDEGNGPKATGDLHNNLDDSDVSDLDSSMG